MRAPSKARFLNDAEWAILESVFRSTLPIRYRILVTDALGGGDRAFTIPTSAITLLTIPAAIQDALTAFATAKMGAVGDTLASVSNFVGFTGPGALPSQLGGLINMGYIVNVGPEPYSDLSTKNPALLVHELTHVWQGSNSTSATTYVHNSLMNQCRSEFGTGSHGGAYGYTPGGIWSAYNAEQQASIVEDWYVSGMPESGPLWPYIRNNVRTGSV